MAQFYSGKDGVLLLSNDSSKPAAITGYFSGAEAKVVDWSLDVSYEALETTTLGDRAKTYTPGVQEASGSANLLFYKNGSNSLVFNILNDIVAKGGGTTTGERRYLTLALERGVQITFACYITSCSLSVGTGDVAKAAINFTVDGPIETVKLLTSSLFV